MNDKTVKEYLSYFADAYLLFTLDSFSYSVREQIKSPKKVYIIDTGMAGAAGFSFSLNQGHLLENLVYLQLKRRGSVQLNYYKTENGLEVDFADSTCGKVNRLIQVAQTLGDDKTRERELRALVKAMDETGLKQGEIITYEEEDFLHVDDKAINLIPAYKFLLE